MVSSQDERIEKIEAQVSDLGVKVTGIQTDVKWIAGQIADINKKVEEHDYTLYGHDQTPGVVSQVLQAVNILNDLVIALRGEKDKPGLVGTVSKVVERVEDWEDSRKWITRLVIGWVVTVILGAIIVVNK